MDHLARLQVDRVDHDGRSSGVDCQAQNAAPVGVDALTVEVDIVAASRGERVEVDVPVDGAGQDAGLPAQDGELDVGRRVCHAGLAGQPVAVPQEGLRLGEAAQRAHAAPHVDDALVALARAAARGRDSDLQSIGIVEEALPDS